jgi:hypothetical protein
MEPARELRSPDAGEALPYSVDHADHRLRRPELVVLQVDGTVSAIDGLAWLTSRRNSETAHGIDALLHEAAEQRWSWAELTRARLKHLRPRRAEINELGAAYLAALTRGAVESVSALRRAGISITLASDVAAEALFGVATALGVSPNELQAPRIRFDAIGAYVGCDLGAVAAAASDPTGYRAATSSPRTLFVGTRRSEMFAPRGTDTFIAFSGVVALEGPSDAKASVSSFQDLTALVLG